MFYSTDYYSQSMVAQLLACTFMQIEIKFKEWLFNFCNTALYLYLLVNVWSLILLTVYYASGTSISKFPADGVIIREDLKNQGHEVITGNTLAAAKVPILGLHQVRNMLETGVEVNGGRVALYGDSNCLDNSHLQKGSICNVFIRSDLLEVDMP